MYIPNWFDTICAVFIVKPFCLFQPTRLFDTFSPYPLMNNVGIGHPTRLFETPRLFDRLEYLILFAYLSLFANDSFLFTLVSTSYLFFYISG